MSKDRDGIDRLLTDVLAANPEDEYDLARQRAVDRFVDSIAAGTADEPQESGTSWSSSPGNRRIGILVAALVLVGLTTLLVLRLFDREAPRADSFDYGPAASVMEQFREPVLLTATRTDPSLAGRPMASGDIFDPDLPIAASGQFPIGVVLHLESSTGEGTAEVTVRDIATTELVLSDGALQALGLSPSAGRFRVWVQATDYEAKRARP